MPAILQKNKINMQADFINEREDLLNEAFLIKKNSQPRETPKLRTDETINSYFSILIFARLHSINIYYYRPDIEQILKANYKPSKNHNHETKKSVSSVQSVSSVC
jgi:hypothetical protein